MGHPVRILQRELRFPWQVPRFPCAPPYCRRARVGPPTRPQPPSRVIRSVSTAGPIACKRGMQFEGCHILFRGPVIPRVFVFVLAALAPWHDGCERVLLVSDLCALVRAGGGRAAPAAARGCDRAPSSVARSTQARARADVREAWLRELVRCLGLLMVSIYMLRVCLGYVYGFEKRFV